MKESSEKLIDELIWMLSDRTMSINTFINKSAALQYLSRKLNIIADDLEIE